MYGGAVKEAAIVSASRVANSAYVDLDSLVGVLVPNMRVKARSLAIPITMLVPLVVMNLGYFESMYLIEQMVSVMLAVMYVEVYTPATSTYDRF